MSTSGECDEVDPAQPDRNTHARMWWHIAQKGWQLGSVIGTVAVVPIAFYRTRVPDTALAAAGRALPAGVAFACAVGAYKLVGEPKDLVEDRVYKLYYNEGQNRVDRFAQAGALLGAMSALVSGPGSYRSRAWAIVGQAGVGTALAIGVHAVYPAKVADGGSVVTK